MNHNENIVIFGPTNSGKTTLLGYCMAKNMTPDEYDRFINKKKELLGSNYAEERKLTYFLDTGADEIIDKTKKNNKRSSPPGTSMRKKFQQISINSLAFTAIDTPGTNYHKKGFQSIPLGEIGIFVIEIQDILTLCDSVLGSYDEPSRKMESIFSSVELWIKTKGKNQLIIVISKTEGNGISDYDIERAKIFIRKEYAELDTVPIIPTGINVRDCKGINILDEDPKVNTDSSLMEIIKAKLDNYTVPSRKMQYSFATIDRIFNKTKNLKASALRIKVSSGSFHEKDQVCLAPFVYKNQVVSVSGSIRSLMLEGNKQIVSQLSINDIGGVVFSKLKCGKDDVDLKDLKLLSTSVIYNNDIEYSYGNILTLTARKSYETESIFNPVQNKTTSGKKDITLIWFGKPVSLRILSCISLGQDIRIRVMNTQPNGNDFFLVPLNHTGNFIFNNFVLAFKGKFFSAVLNEISLITDDEPRKVMLNLKKNYSYEMSLVTMAEKFAYVSETNETIFDFPPMGRSDFINLLSSKVISPEDIKDIKPKPVDN